MLYTWCSLLLSILIALPITFIAFLYSNGIVINRRVMISLHTQLPIELRLRPNFVSLLFLIKLHSLGLQITFIFAAILIYSLCFIMCSISRYSADRQRCYSSESLLIMIIAEIFSFNKDRLEQLSSSIYRRFSEFQCCCYRPCCLYS